MTSISERARPNPPGIKDMPESEQAKYIDEQYRLKAIAWAKADGDAFYLVENKTTMLEKMKAELAKELDEKIADSALERAVKTSEAWAKYLLDMRDRRVEANTLKGEMEALRLKERRVDRGFWHAQTERKMARSTT